MRSNGNGQRVQQSRMVLQKTWMAWTLDAWSHQQRPGPGRCRRQGAVGNRCSRGADGQMARPG